MASIFNSFFSGMKINEPGLNLDDPRWSELEGGYREIKYDASPALKQLEQAKNLEQVNTIYSEFWNELHHQGDVGVASYYAVPHLVEIAFKTGLINYNVLHFSSVVDVQRRKNNPPLPKALEPKYFEAIQKLDELASIVLAKQSDFDSITSGLIAIAVVKGQYKLADALLRLDSPDSIDEFLENN